MNRSRSRPSVTSGIAEAGSGHLAGSHSCPGIASSNLPRCKSEPHKYSLLTPNAMHLHLSSLLAESQATRGLPRTGPREGECHRGSAGGEGAAASGGVTCEYMTWAPNRALKGVCAHKGPKCHQPQGESALPTRAEPSIHSTLAFAGLAHRGAVGQCRLVCFSAG